MKSVILDGYFGYGNLGDELILKNVASLFRGLGYEGVYALTSNIGYSRERHNDIEFIDRKDLHSILRHVSGCSLVVLAGGGLFQEYNKLSLLDLLKGNLEGINAYLVLPLAAKMYQRPCYYLFQGVGPFFSDEGVLFARYAYSLSPLTLVRDINSYKKLKELGIDKTVLSADPVFLSPQLKEKRDHKRKKIALCLRDWIDNELISAIIKTISTFIIRYGRESDIEFVSFQESGIRDSVIYEKIIKDLSKAYHIPIIKTEGLTLEEAEAILSEYSLIIGMRYHSILLAIKYDIPFIAINYWDKVRNLVEEIGLSELLIEPGDLSFQRLDALFKGVISQYEQISSKIAINKIAFYNRLDTSINLLKDELSGSKDMVIESASNHSLDPGKYESYLENWIRYKNYQAEVKRDFYTPFFSRHNLDRLLADCGPEKILIYPSFITWDTTFFQRPHQILREFAKRGYKVFFISPDPIRDKALPINQVGDNLFVISSVKLLQGLKEAPIIILMTWTMNIVYRQLFPKSLVIYDWLDHLEVFKEYYSPFMEIDHLRLLKSADLVTVTSDALLREAKRTRGDALLVPNAARVEDFVIDSDAPVPEDLLPIIGLNKPIIGYYGLFALWRFDYDLVNYLTASMSDVVFVFIGLSDDDSQRLFQQRANLFILPPKKYTELKYYMRFFDVGIIPYKIDRIAETIFPNKLCEFLSMGIPVVTTALPECKKFKTLLISDNYNGFVKNIYRAIGLSKDPNQRESIKQEALENSWQHRVDVIIEAISKISKKEAEYDIELLIQENEALNTIQDILLSKNRSLFEGFKDAISDRDKTWLQLNRVIEEKGTVASELETKVAELETTKAELFFLRREYDGLQRLYHSVINSLTWRVGQFIGRLIGVESPWRRALKRCFNKAADRQDVEINAQGSEIKSWEGGSSATEPVGKAYPDDLFKGTRYDVIFFSMIDFSFRYQRPQQLATYLSKRGHRVFYLNITQFLPLDDPRQFETRQLAENLFEVFVKTTKALDIYGGSIDEASLEAITRSLYGLRHKFNIATAISIVHNPFWTRVAFTMKDTYGWKVLYDCLDEWETFTGIGDYVLAQERQLVGHCDVLTVTADKLLKKWDSLNNRGLIVRNACDYEYFSKASASELLKDTSRPIIGFFGGIADWIEIDYIKIAATKKRGWNFVMLGGIFTDVSSIKDLPNVYLPGNQPYHLMRDYLYKFDVCLIPFKRNKITEAVDPVKLYEYFSLGKPVVARDLYEIRFYKEVLYLFDTAEEFIEAIERALAEDSEALRQRRISIASTNTWADRVEQIDQAVKALFPKVSIIIVTYNNIQYNRLCIESILTKTDYPDYEVIIIDNRSTDGTRDFLKTITDSRVKVILNEENEGFAKANNRGLRESRGDYIVFLNNDTVVTKGWLTRFVYYLDKFKEIGMIGPVTNFCGNEAKVDLPYTELGDMDACAYEYTSRHEGKLFDIPMLALFCAAMRRDTFDKVGFLDEAFGIGMFEDDDYSYRIKSAGLRIVCAEDIFIHHFGQGAFKKLIDDGSYNQLFEKNRQYYEKKWGKKWLPHGHRGNKPITYIDFNLSSKIVSSEVPLTDPSRQTQNSYDASTPSDDALSQAVRSLDTVEALSDVDDRLSQTKSHWDQEAGTWKLGRGIYWLEHQEVLRRINLKVSGDPDIDAVSYFMGLLKAWGYELPLERALTLGCGAGDLERRLAGYGLFLRHDAYDISEKSVEMAARAAKESGFTNIYYQTTNINKVLLPEETYDVVFGFGSVHHLSRLEHVFSEVNKSLKKDGIFFLNEYIGPSFFQWTDRQIEVINSILKILPKRLKQVVTNPEFYKEHYTRPSVEEVQGVDPSEACRSEEILPLLESFFDVVIIKQTGGALLHSLLTNIAGNFRTENEVDIELLKAIFMIEDALMREGDIKSDFAVIVARKKGI